MSKEAVVAFELERSSGAAKVKLSGGLVACRERERGGFRLDHDRGKGSASALSVVGGGRGRGRGRGGGDCACGDGIRRGLSEDMMKINFLLLTSDFDQEHDLL